MFKSTPKKPPSYKDFTKALGEASFYRHGSPYSGELGLGGEVTAVGVDPVGGWMAVGECECLSELGGVCLEFRLCVLCELSDVLGTSYREGNGGRGGMLSSTRLGFILLAFPQSFQAAQAHTVTFLQVPQVVPFISSELRPYRSSCRSTATLRDRRPRARIRSSSSAFIPASHALSP
jgi:hypothetical protein